MKRDDTVYLQHILDDIARIEEYLQGVNEEVFHHRYLIQDGVIRQVEIIRPVWLEITSNDKGQD